MPAPAETNTITADDLRTLLAQQTTEIAVLRLEKVALTRTAAELRIALAEARVALTTHKTSTGPSKTTQGPNKKD